MKLLSNPFKKAAPVRSPSDAPVQPQIMYLTSGTSVAIVQWNDRIAASMAMKHPIVHRALDKIASSVQQCRFLVQEDEYASATERSGNAAKAKKLQAVLDNPNDNMSAPMFRYWMGLTYAVYGRTPLRITMGAMDPTTANALYALDAGYVYAKRNIRGNVDRYEYGQTDTKQTFPSLESFYAKPTPGGVLAQLW